MATVMPEELAKLHTVTLYYVDPDEAGHIAETFGRMMGGLPVAAVTAPVAVVLEVVEERAPQC